MAKGHDRRQSRDSWMLLTISWREHASIPFDGMSRVGGSRDQFWCPGAIV
jgi:hypothetical protein